MGTRSAEVGRGLAQVQSGVGTLISFSTQPGNVALDGTDRNSPFAGALVKQLSSTNDDLSAMLIAVRNDVMKQTQRKQVPWEHSALTGRFYFNPAAQTAEPAKSTPPGRISEAAEAWDRTKDATSIAMLEIFIARFKDTYYADLARARIADLKKQQVTSPASKREQPATVGGMLRCDWLLERTACELDASCSWADSRKQCEQKSGSLATVLLEDSPAGSKTRLLGSPDQKDLAQALRR